MDIPGGKEALQGARASPACVRENVSVSEKTHIPPAPQVLQLVVGAHAGG